MTRRRWFAVVAVLLAVAAAIALWIAGSSDGDPADGSAAPATSSTARSAPASTTTSTTLALPLPPGVTPVDTTAVVWPTAAGGVRFTDPVAAARSFAVDYLGFTSPVVGPFVAGATGAGRVEIRPRPGAPNPTVVQLRQLAPDDDWWVSGAAAATIELSQPAALELVSSPVTLRGRSTAFEGTVSIKIRADDRAQLLADTFVTGGSTAELGPFVGQIAFSSPGRTPNGAIVLASYSAEDGRLTEATVVRVRFGQARAGGQAATCSEPPARAPLVAGQTELRVFFSCGSATATQPVFRIVPSTTGVLRASLNQLLAGPTAGERAAGFVSAFSAATSGLVAGVDLDADGSARVDFTDLRGVLDGAVGTDGTAMLLAQLDATVFQFPTVRSVVYRLAGDCQAFADWLHLAGCEPRRRS